MIALAMQLGLTPPPRARSILAGYEADIVLLLSGFDAGGNPLPGGGLTALAVVAAARLAPRTIDLVHRALSRRRQMSRHRRAARPVAHATSSASSPASSARSGMP